MAQKLGDTPNLLFGMSSDSLPYHWRRKWKTKNWCFFL